VSGLSWQLSSANLTYSEAVIWLLLAHLLSLQKLLAEKLSSCKMPTEILENTDIPSWRDCWKPIPTWLGLASTSFPLLSFYMHHMMPADKA